MRFFRISAALACVLALVGVAAWFWYSRTSSNQAAFTQTQSVDGLQVTLELDRAEPGARVANLLIHDEQGAPAAVGAVRLRFTMAAMDMPRTETSAVPAGAGRFRAQGSFFSMVGQWSVEALLEREGMATLAVAFAVPVAAPGELGGPINPLTSESAAVEAGRLLYQANCTVCHGVSHRGDGPAAAMLNPRPADLTQHMQAGLHTDGQIFLWIRDGYPGAAMPAWGDRLSEQQIWQLVVYLRSLAPAAVAQESAPAPATAQAPLPPLVFARQSGIWRVDADRKPVLLARVQGAVAVSPTVAPDGRQVAFAGLFPAPAGAELPFPSSKLYMVNSDGGQPRPIWEPPQGQIGRLAWIPDASALYVGITGLRAAPTALGGTRLQEIVRVDAVTGAVQPLLEDALDPDISRDGAWMAYVRAGEGGSEEQAATAGIEISSMDGVTVRQLVDGAQFGGLAAPRFSPDGRWLVFAAGDRPAPAATPQAGGDLSGWLAGLLAPPVASAHAQQWNLWAVNVDGSNLRQLARLDEDLPVAAFSPDGQAIAVLAEGGLYHMNADGSALRKLDPWGDFGGLDWLRP